MAGTIKYLAPVDNASGKIFGKKEKFISVTRKAGKAIRNCRASGVVTKQPSQAMLTARENFKKARAYMNSVLLNSNLKTVAEAMFGKQKKCITIRGFLIADWFSTKPYGGTIKEEI